jgi:hypothetical protein
MQTNEKTAETASKADIKKREFIGFAADATVLWYIWYSLSVVRQPQQINGQVCIFIFPASCYMWRFIGFGGDPFYIIPVRVVTLAQINNDHYAPTLRVSKTKMRNGERACDLVRYFLILLSHHGHIFYPRMGLMLHTHTHTHIVSLLAYSL